MRVISFVAILTLSTLSPVLTAPAAQEGHPLTGAWLGTWGPSQDHNDDVIVTMDWDGQNIMGIINPGTDNMPIENARLEPENWTVRLEAEGRDRSGNALHYVIEGRIENLALPNRSIVGTWRSARESGPFEITLQ